MKAVYLILFVSVLYSCSEKDSIRAIEMQAKKYERESNWKQTESCYNQLIQLRNGEPKYYYERGKARLSLRELDSAKADFNYAINKKYKLANSYYNLGIAHIAESDSLVLKYIRKCLEIEPKHKKAKWMLENLSNN
jgi:tetratricopeptide (TPR) repeat protein